MIEKLKQKLSTNKAPQHFLAYSFSFLAYGSIISGIGPLVPYLSEKTGYPETEYSSLFLCRSVGLVIGALILRNLEKKFTFHQILLYSSIILLFLCSIFCLIFNITYQAVVIFLISVICCFIEVTINLSVLETQKNGNIQLWMLVCHGFFGIGGLIGPFLVCEFQIYSYVIMGIMIFIVCPFYYILPTPEKHSQVIQRVSKENYFDQITNLGHQSQYPIIEHKQQRKNIGKQIKYLMCLMCFLYVGMQIGFSSWISSYMVMQEIASKQAAAKFNSIFWISFTFFRFITPCIPYTPFKKLFLFGYSLCLSTIMGISLIAIGLPGLACTLTTVTFGMCLSSLFPLMLAVPAQYNLEISSSQGAIFMISMALGQGILSSITGYLMAWFSNDFLFISMVLISFVFLASIYYLKTFYQNQKVNQQEKQQEKYSNSNIIDCQNPEIELTEIFIYKK